MPKLGITSGLPALPAGLSDEKAALVIPLYRAIHNVAQQLSLTAGAVTYTQAELATLNPLSKLTSSATQRVIVKAAEDLSYGMLLNLAVDAQGLITAQKADYSLSLPAHAVLESPQGVLTDSYGEALLMTGHTASIGGSVGGTFYYLSTAGLVQTPAPSVTGDMVQAVGVGLATRGFFLNISAPGVAP